MNPITIALAFVAGALIWKYTKIAKAGTQLTYKFLKYQIYKFSSSGLQIRILANFSNPNNTDLQITMVDITAYINSKVTNGKVTDKGSVIGYCQSDKTITIPGGKISETYLYCTLPYATLLKNLGLTIISAISGGNWKPGNAYLEGFIKAEGVKINIATLIPFNSTSTN